MAKKASPKKKVLAEITSKLSMAFPDLKTTLGEKKFARRAKKAAKILNAGIRIKPEEKTKTRKKAVKQELIEKPAEDKA